MTSWPNPRTVSAALVTTIRSVQLTHVRDRFPMRVSCLSTGKSQKTSTGRSLLILKPPLIVPGFTRADWLVGRWHTRRRHGICSWPLDTECLVRAGHGSRCHNVLHSTRVAVDAEMGFLHRDINIGNVLMLDPPVTKPSGAWTMEQLVTQLRFQDGGEPVAKHVSLLEQTIRGLDLASVTVLS